MNLDVPERPVVFWRGDDRFLGIVAGTNVCWPGICLMLPGSGPQNIDGQVGPNRFLLQLATGLARRGIATARFGKVPLSSGGLDQPDTYDAEYVEPAVCLLRELQARGLATAPLVLIGHSLGGHVAPLVARQVPSVAGICVVNAHFDELCSTLRWQIDTFDMAQDDRTELESKCSAAVAMTPAHDHDDPMVRYLAHARAYSVDAALKGTKARFLCVSCGKDAQISRQQSDRWMKSLHRQRLQATKYFYPDLNHLGMRVEQIDRFSIYRPGEVDPELIADLADWVATLPRES